MLFANHCIDKKESKKQINNHNGMINQMGPPTSLTAKTPNKLLICYKIKSEDGPENMLE